MRGGRGRRAKGLEAQESVFLVLEGGKGEVLVFLGVLYFTSPKKRGGKGNNSTRMKGRT